MVGRLKFGSSSEISFEPVKHRYIDATGAEYQSVSRLLNSIEIPFDREGISMMMAKGNKNRQVEILAEWDAKLESSHIRGNWIHDNLEDFHKLGTCDDAIKPVVEKIKPFYENYFRVYTEVLLSDYEYIIAGQTDLVVQRQRSENSLYDFYDYKTNEQKGIEFDSIRRKREPWQHYNKFFLPPLSHLEDCNYNRYSLQLSLYACIAQRQYGIRIGRLALIFIDKDLQVYDYPVSYLRFEAEALLAHSAKTFKPLPQIQKHDWSSEETPDENDW
jgi:hypothetical protein